MLLRACTAILPVLILISAARADSSGITGYSGMDPGSTCGQCHSGGHAPMRVEITGPATLETGQSGTYTIDIVSGATAQTYAGIDVAASGGSLFVHAGQAGTKLQNGEIVHSQVAGPASTVRFQFDFAAPAMPGTITIFGDGLSANGNGATDGDLNVATQFTVNVVSGDGDGGVTQRDAAAVDAVTGASSMAAPSEPRWGCACELARQDPDDRHAGPWVLAGFYVLGGVIAGARARRGQRRSAG